MTSIINSRIPEFKVQAFHNGKFVTVSNEDLKGKWAVFFFYRNSHLKTPKSSV